jgi:hypothetical protein
MLCKLINMGEQQETSQSVDEIRAQVEELSLGDSEQQPAHDATNGLLSQGE